MADSDHQAPGPPPTHEPVFDKAKHVRYWLRCFKTLLPTHYTSTDSNRMFLAFTILSSLDILGVLHSPQIKPEERSDAVNWIYHCQHVNGGFRGFPGTIYGADADGKQNIGPEAEYLDQANLAGTSFALASLVVLRDDLTRVKRGKCLAWLKRLQAENGAFTQVFGVRGLPEGARDVRHSYFAVAARSVLGAIREVKPEEDFDRAKLLESVYASQNYDGGISGEPGLESHGGYGYCAVGCIWLVDDSGKSSTSKKSAEFIRRLIPNLVSRQIRYDEPGSEDEDEDEEDGDEAGGVETAREQRGDGEGVEDLASIPMPRWVGFDGRCNKPADTCYTFWVGATLGILDLSDRLIDPTPHRRFLLEQTEHRIGGFGKTPGDPPDALHSFMGLLALALMHEPGLEPVNPAMAITQVARDHLECMRKERT